MRGKVTFELGDNARDATGEKFETAAEGADHERIEAIVTGKNFPLKMVGLVGLFAKENRMDFRAVEKDDPVTGEFGMENRDKIDVIHLCGGFPFGPNTDGIQPTGEFPVAVLLMKEVIEVLKGGDEFPCGGFVCKVLDRVADGQHRLMIEEVIDVGRRDGFRLGAFCGPAFLRSPHSPVFFHLEIGLQTALEAAV